MKLPEYPEFAPIELSMQNEITGLLSVLTDGISEFTFAGLYLFRDTYQYTVSLLPPSCCSDRRGLIVSGEEHTREGEREHFIMLPHGFPTIGMIDEFFSGFCGIKNFPDSEAEKYRIDLERRGYCVTQDRNNFDYLYTRRDLAELSGRKFHKKRNLVNAFINNYNYEEKPITRDNRPDLYSVLEAWSEDKGGGDYKAAKEAIDLIDLLGLRGCITYVDGRPCAYSMGEVYCQGSMFAVHFEKAIGSYKGIYQFINQSFASMLDESITYINREQDLGNQGLRQAKMSYRPTGFVRKYRICSSEFAPCDEIKEEIGEAELDD